ncbi:hypothetical protein QRD89_05880 [Halobacillus sp. ACCC02827]|uniref:hypothetical protein n=1 Tax=Bacillaceae TaxID=186817 RepID=UPI0002A4FB31|nr:MULTISPECIES: hypothetical protein [Bacillaceae]ELK45183.1 hypothetical protein D479_15677 [Halobacillus sp. BAB-2008]QHT46064.1 hypothetical protein M662_06015 [Bacillus sp. SB49]WJE16875.1 hypothetical protein QRD89_05880 [Halobacillus sp. ACCC02827]
MSEKKKVIHVKDLIIKADNVIIEPQHHRPDHHGQKDRDDFVDPFFGGRRHREEAAEESSSREKHHKKEDDESSDRRGGFRWF